MTATRTYGLNGQTVATRTSAGVEYLLADQQGSVQAAVPSGGADASATRVFLPYGETEVADGEVASDREWLDEVGDDSTGLQYLNARYYDPNLGFISPDPLFDTSRPGTVNPYTYGLGNPATNADPSGEAIPVENHGRPRVFWNGNVRRANGQKGAFYGSTRAMGPVNDFVCVRGRVVG